jgi:acyl-CoA synthetase (NDP forming)
MRQVTGNEEAVSRIWTPRSVAIIGASSRPGTLPWWPLHLHQQYGFTGALYPVNPNRAEIEGVPCMPSVSAIPGPVDLAVVALGAEASVTAVAQCAEAGVGAVVLPAQGFGELGEHGRAMEAEILRTAKEAGMRVVGPNTDGVGNLASGALATIQPLFGQGFEVGEVAVITQSGASAGSLISRLHRAGVGCRLYASAGNELDLGLADFMSVALQDPNVRMVLSFVEAVRRPADFVEVARMASELGKPIVLIKVGRTDQAAQRAAAHTGALAGADRIYDALFRSLGIIRVDDLSELVAVASMFLSSGTPEVPGVGIMSVSGGQAGAMADRAAGFGVPVPEISAETRATLTELLPFGTPLNPCDLTGDVAKRADLAAVAYDAFDQDEAIGTVVYARKELTGAAGRESAVQLADAAAGGRTPLVVYAMDGQLNEQEATAYADAGVPTFESASEMFTAIARLAEYAARRPATPQRLPADVRPLPAHAGNLDDVATKELLAAYGITVPAEGLAVDGDAAVTLADELGYPVVLKVVSERIAHKTEIGGVLLGVADAAAVREGFALLLERGRSALDGQEPDGVLVQQQVVDGVEMIVGLVVDEQLGPFVLVGTGGIMAELLDDAVLRPAPVSEEEAVDMIAELRGETLLTGFRGAPRADVPALAATVSALSRLGADHAASIAEADLNPVLVRPNGLGAVAADALVVLRGGAGE